MKKIFLGLFVSLSVTLPVFAITDAEVADTETLPTDTTTSTTTTDTSDTDNSPTLTSKQKSTLIQNCSTIRDELKSIQKEDAKIRVYLGRYYEALLKDFITPLNIRLVENSLSNADFIENQNEFTDARSLFSYDFVVYQQSLEDLIAIDCAKEPDLFYDKLDLVRKKRKIMTQDVLKLRTLISEHLQLIEQLKGKL